MTVRKPLVRIGGQVTQLPDGDTLDAALAPEAFFEMVTVGATAAGQTTFTIPGGYTPGAVVVFLNGSSLAPAHYTATNGTAVVLASGTGVVVGSELVLLRLSAFEVADALPLNGTAQNSLRFAGLLPPPSDGKQYALKDGAWAEVEASGGGGTDVWLSKPIGEPFAIWDHIAGVPTPPTDNAGYRFIRLTASDSYNTGVLASESVSGAAPLVQATAVISDSGSPLNGQTVRLINTERRFVRPGSSGTVEADALQNITGTLYGRVNRSIFGAWTAGAFARTDPTVIGYNDAGPSLDGHSSVTFDASRVARTADETRVKNIGATYYMRIR